MWASPPFRRLGGLPRLLTPRIRSRARRPRRTPPAGLAGRRGRERHREAEPSCPTRSGTCAPNGAAARPGASASEPGRHRPELVTGGDWVVTYPRRAPHLRCALSADHGRRWSGRRAVEHEIEEWVHRGRLRRTLGWPEHPPRWRWDCGVVPAEIPVDQPPGRRGSHRVSPVISGALSCHRLRLMARRRYVHPLCRESPTICFGPGGIGSAHAVNERVSVDEPARLHRRHRPHGDALVWGGVKV